MFRIVNVLSGFPFSGVHKQHVSSRRGGSTPNSVCGHVCVRAHMRVLRSLEKARWKSGLT